MDKNTAPNGLGRVNYIGIVVEIKIDTFELSQQHITALSRYTVYCILLWGLGLYIHYSIISFDFAGSPSNRCLLFSNKLINALVNVS